MSIEAGKLLGIIGRASLIALALSCGVAMVGVVGAVVFA